MGVPQSLVLGDGKVIQPLMTGILIMGPYKPLRTWVDDHPLLYGNYVSLDPSIIWHTAWHTPISFILLISYSTCIPHAFQKLIPKWVPQMVLDCKSIPSQVQKSHRHTHTHSSPFGMRKLHLCMACIEVSVSRKSVLRASFTRQNFHL